MRSVDEKSGIQAKSRVNPTKPAIPGGRVRREFEYRRHGTAVLFAGLKVHAGDVAGWVTDSTRAEHFVDFLAKYKPHTSAALAQNSGSCEVIHDSVCHGLRSRLRQIRHTCDAEIGT
jgi:hypothetical protein